MKQLVSFFLKEEGDLHGFIVKGRPEGKLENHTQGMDLV